MKIIHTRNLNKKVFKLSDTESEYSLNKFIHDESYDIIKILTAAINYHCNHIISKEGQSSLNRSGFTEMLDYLVKDNDFDLIAILKIREVIE